MQCTDINIPKQCMWCEHSGFIFCVAWFACNRGETFFFIYFLLSCLWWFSFNPFCHRSINLPRISWHLFCHSWPKMAENSICCAVGVTLLRIDLSSVACVHISSQSLLFTSQFTGNLSEWSSYNSRFHQKFDWIERISDRKLSQMNRCWTEATTITSSFIHKDTTKKLRSNTHTNTPCEWNGHVST